MGEHRALVVTVPSAALREVNGGSLRVADVVAALGAAGHEADVVQSPPPSGRWCTAVAVSYASAGHVPALRRLAPRVWLDAMDSWLLLDRTGVRAGHLSYAARGLRDAARLARMPRVELATYISRADLRSDRGTVRARRRLVLPGGGTAPPVRAANARRAVVVGDWGYPPNRDGLAWLLRHVVPLIDAPLHVYGPGAGRTGPGVHVHGYVDDTSEMYTAGDVHLAPVRFGAGVKRKVLQPLLAGLPVVSTRAGAHGLRAHPLLDVEDDPRRFAAALRRRLAVPHVPAVRTPLAPSAVLDGDDGPEVLDWVRACQLSPR